MKYYEYKIYTAPERLPELVQSLTLLGFSQLVINDPAEAAQFKSGSSDGYLWNYVDPSVIEQLEEGAWACFYLSEDEAAALTSGSINSAIMASAIPGSSAPAHSGSSAPATPVTGTASYAGLTAILRSHDYRRTLVDDQDWLHKWEEYFVPRKLGAVTVVKPVWRDYAAVPGELVIDIDPGMAFGSGTSPTTYLAIRLMEKLLRPKDRVLDVGCGTGILSILAAKLGCTDITALDLDPEAIRSTVVNCALNGCLDRVRILEGDLLSALSGNAGGLDQETIEKYLSEVALDMQSGNIENSAGLAKYMAARPKDLSYGQSASNAIQDAPTKCAQAPVEAAQPASDSAYSPKTFENFDQSAPADTFNLVVANLTADLHLRLCPDIRSCFEISASGASGDSCTSVDLSASGRACTPAEPTPRAIYIASGIIEDKAELVARAIEGQGFRIIDTIQDGYWVAMAAEISRTYVRVVI